jgi:hypothetical protein
VTQRAWRAACPNCGAPVEFASAASASAVCGYCSSTLLRDGEALRRIGVVAELFDDHSPLQLGVRGTRQGLGFTLVGRLQYGYAGGTWNEWHALFDNQRSAWLSEDNGAYVLAFDAPLPADAPDAATLATLQPGRRITLDGRAWDVASVQRTRLVSAQGELPLPPRLEGEFGVIDLRNTAGEVATLDFSDPAAPHWSTGRAVALSELALSGLKEGPAEATLRSRSLECPSCGTALSPKLDSTQSLSCPQCQAVVDISAGAGAELKHYAQNNSGSDASLGLQPQLPLGATGTLALGGEAVPWQVVGYQERCDIPEDSEDETSFWREYLLYNRSQGFAFLVDAEDGWSWVKPITGVPQTSGRRATWQGAEYEQTWSYAAKVSWVQGEFYWRVQRDERAQVTDYVGRGAAAAKRLSREATGSELTWSAGETLAAATVAAAFKIPLASRPALQRDVAPLSSGLNLGGKGMTLLFVVIVIVALLSQCSDDECDQVRSTFGASSAEYRQCERERQAGRRTSGGSFGGWSSGGSHK